jgi:cytochrome c oxidase assembly factor CtaG
MDEKQPTLQGVFHRFDLVIGAAIVAGVVWYVRRHLRHRAEG